MSNLPIRQKISKIFYKAASEDVNEFTDIYVKNNDKFMILSKKNEEMFFAQLVAESGLDLIPRRENMNYSCRALTEIFGFYKHNRDLAIIHGRCNRHNADQVAIANHAYANRLGNGSIESGDGYRFRGGGYIQITGKSNYASIASVIGRGMTAEMLADNINTIEYALLSAMAFWKINKCYECNDIDCVTSKVNKYTKTYAKRSTIYENITRLA